MHAELMLLQNEEGRWAYLGGSLCRYLKSPQEDWQIVRVKGYDAFWGTPYHEPFVPIPLDGIVQHFSFGDFRLTFDETGKLVMSLERKITEMEGDEFFDAKVVRLGNSASAVRIKLYKDMIFLRPFPLHTAKTAA